MLSVLGSYVCHVYGKRICCWRRVMYILRLRVLMLLNMLRHFGTEKSRLDVILAIEVLGVHQCWLTFVVHCYPLLASPSRPPPGSNETTLTLITTHISSLWLPINTVCSKFYFFYSLKFSGNAKEFVKHLWSYGPSRRVARAVSERAPKTPTRGLSYNAKFRDVLCAIESNSGRFYTTETKQFLKLVITLDS